MKFFWISNQAFISANPAFIYIFQGRLCNQYLKEIENVSQGLPSGLPHNLGLSDLTNQYVST
jgi:hypothetical protein